MAQTYFQLESDAVHVTQSGSTLVIEALDPVLKYGLTSNIEIDLQTDGLLDMPVTARGRTYREVGFGDVTPAVKYNFVGNDSGVVSAALRAGVKLPTATPGFGNGQVEYNAVLTAQATLPLALALGVQQEVDLLKNQADTGYHFNYAESVSLGRTFGKTTLAVDAYADSGTDPASPPLYTVDFGASYALTPVSVVVLGAYAGLNRYAPKVEAYTSFAFRF